MNKEELVLPIAEGVVGTPFARGLDLPNLVLSQRQVGASGMLSQMERAMLIALTQKIYRGDGAIVDGGSFFGSSLIACVTGLEANPKFGEMDFSDFPDGKPIHGYDLGFLPAPASEKIDRHRIFGGVKYVLGDSFVPILEENVAPHRDLISLHIGDLKGGYCAR